MKMRFSELFLRRYKLDEGMHEATWPTEAAKTFPPWGQARYIQKINRLNTQTQIQDRIYCQFHFNLLLINLFI